MRVETRESGGIAGPAKWAAVGALGGAAVMGVIGAMVLRQPRDLVAADRAPVPTHAFVTKPEPPTPAPAPPQSLAAEPKPEVQPSTPSKAIAPQQEPAKTEPTPEPKPPTPDPVPSPPPATPPPSPAPVTPAPPTPKPTTPAPSTSPKAPALVGKLNINKATQAELELLPSIGPAIAKRIIDYRTAHGLFKRVDDLDKVKGIGPKTLEKLRPLVTVQ